MTPKKSTLAVFCTLVAGAASLYAPDCRADNFGGLGLGLNFSNLTNAGSTSGTTSFVANVFADLKFGGVGNWYAHIGLQYDTYGVNFASNAAGAVSVNTQYFEIPLLVKSVFTVGSWFPYAQLGPVIAFNVAEDATYSDVEAEPTVTTSDFNSLNLAVDAGIGAMFPVQEGLRAFMEFDYLLGLGNVIDSTNVLGITGSVKTRGAMLLAGIVTEF